MTARFPFVLFAALLAVAAPPPASATQVMRLDTEALTGGSNDIVVGRVEGTRSYWNPARTKILTDVTVAVDQTVKGSGAPRLVLTQLGGEVDGVRTTVEGGPLFAPGEEVLLFVWRDARGRAQVNGLSQGKFEIARDPATGARTVQRSLPGLVVRDARTLSAVPQGEPAPRITLEAMLGEIQNALKEGGR